MAHGNGTRPPGAAPGQRLQSVHEQLKDLIESLREQRERRAREGSSAAPAPSAISSPPDGSSSAPAPEVLDLEKRRLSAELAEARAELARLSAEEAQLRRRVADLEKEHQRLNDDYVAVEEQNSELASLFVALERLYGSADRRDALTAVQEIVVNMVGSEELGVYRLEPSGGLELAHGFGLADARPDRFSAGHGTVSRVAARGAPFVAGRGETCEDPDLTAAIPLKSAGRVAGVLAIWRLLGHKPFLTDLDHRIFSVLESHAGRWLSPVAE